MAVARKEGKADGGLPVSIQLILPIYSLFTCLESGSDSSPIPLSLQSAAFVNRC